MNLAFYGASNLTLTATDAPNLTGVTDMSYMFGYASAFNQNISSWDVSTVTNMQYMFYSASAFNQDISSWDVSKVTNMQYMFYSASAFNQNISSWDVSTVTNMQYMFTSATLSYINYDALLTGWSSQVLKPSVNFSAGNSKYCDQAKRDILTSAPNNWIITDG